VRKSPSDTRTIYTGLGCDEHSLTLWVVAELEPQLLVEAAETRWFGLCQCCTDIAERIDHRVNLGIAKSIRDRRVGLLRRREETSLPLCCLDQMARASSVKITVS
jgi:hypothetical protein